MNALCLAVQQSALLKYKLPALDFTKCLLGILVYDIFHFKEKLL